MPTANVKKQSEKKPRAVRKSKIPKYVEDTIQILQQQRHAAIDETRARLCSTLDAIDFVEAQIREVQERTRLLEMQ